MKRYVFILNDDDRMAVCNALHAAHDQARDLYEREKDMSVAPRFVLSQGSYARRLQNLFYRFLNAQGEPEGTESEGESTSRREE